MVRGKGVTVIVPVRDAAQSIDWVLDSLQDQGLDDGELEVLVVDDASRDGTAELLERRAQDDDALRVLRRREPGGLGAARNLGIDEASGRYLFFLDAATALTEGALRALVEVAEKEDSDVVLGRMRGIEGRTAPRVMFGATTLEADLVADNVFYTLAPYRLIRKQLVDRLQARFATDLVVGEDQPFMARCYLEAHKVSICADRDYVLIRPDPAVPAGPGPRSGLGDQVELAVQVIGAIVQSTPRGPLRDGVLRRPLRTTVTKILGPKLLEEEDRERREIVSRLADALTSVWTPDAADHLEPLERTKAEAVLARAPETLDRILEWEAGTPPRLITHDDAGFRPDLPDDLIAQLGRERIAAVPATARASLEGFRVEGASATLHVRGLVESCAVPAHSIVLRLTRRGSEERIDLPATRTRVADLPKGCGLDASFTVDVTALEDGVWDVFLVQRFVGHELSRRLGATRHASIGSDRRFLVDDEGRAIGQAYFTEKHENLSIDRGFVLTKARARAQIIGLLGEDEGAAVPTALLRWAAPSPPRILARIDGPDDSAATADQELASAAVADDLIAVPLDVQSLPTDASLRLVVATDVATAVAVPGSGDAPSVSGTERIPLELSDDGRIRRTEGDR